MWHNSFVVYQVVAANTFKKIGKKNPLWENSRNKMIKNCVPMRVIGLLLRRASWTSRAVTAAINLCTEGTKLSEGLQGKMSEPFSGRGERRWSTPTLLRLPLSEHPDYSGEAGDWQFKIYKLLIVLLKSLNNTCAAGRERGRGWVQCLKKKPCFSSSCVHLCGS